MSATFLVDCSVAMTWLFKDEATAHTRELLRRLDSESVLVPSVWFLEVANVVALAESQGRVTSEESTDFIDDLSDLDVEVDNEAPQRAFSRILPLCRRYRLTSYDATYLELAIRRKLPLASLDEPLRKAAKKAGVPLLGR